MPNIIEISDYSAPELDVFARLTEAQLRSRLEPEKGVFIAEGTKVIGHALDAGYTPVALLMERRQIGAQAREIIARCGGIPVYTADREILQNLTGYALTRGVLCAMRRPRLPGVEAVCNGARRVAVLESIVDTCCDPLHRRAVRVSMGTVFQVPWTRVCDSAAEWPRQGLERLREMGFRTAAMALSETSVAIDDPRLMSEEKLAVVLGTEGDGLSTGTIAACDYTVRIPMAHGVDSLNVAAASAVAFWQLRAR